MNDPIDECAARFGIAPRAFSFWDRNVYLRVPKPSLLSEHPADELHTIFQGAPRLFTNGVVVWGHIIQANHLMFQDGNDDCPGELVYSLEDRQSVDPEYLQTVSTKLGALKGSKPESPGLAEIADYLTKEYVRVFGLLAPPEVSPRFRCRISTTFFVRKHLPRRRICGPLLPVVVHPKEPYIAMPLPQKYWPKELVDWWSE
jgi:hypothetical protein